MDQEKTMDQSENQAPANDHAPCQIALRVQRRRGLTSMRWAGSRPASRVCPSKKNLPKSRGVLRRLVSPMMRCSTKFFLSAKTGI